MKSAVAFVLTVLVFATPATQVLAQTPQQQDAPACQDVPPAQAVTLEQSPVPELPKMNTMASLLPAPNAGLAVALNPGVDELAPAPISTGLKIAIYVVLIAAAVGVLAWWAVQAFCAATSDYGGECSP